MWVHGLKHVVAHICEQDGIESHPMWVRGLKLSISFFTPRNTRSHPMWVRGLKLGTSHYKKDI